MVIHFLEEELRAKKSHEAAILQEGRRLVLEEVETKLSKDEFHAVKGFVNGIFGSYADYSPEIKPIDAVLLELKQINERLHDAFLVVDKIAPQIRNKIIDWAIISQ
jgi:hypothetical protein